MSNLARRMRRSSGAVPLTSVTFRSSSTSTSGSISLPSGAAEYDFCIITDVVVNNDGIAPSAVTPSGWSTGGNALSSGNATHSVRFHGYWKILTAADIAAGSVSAGDGTTADAKMAFCFQPNVGAIISSVTALGADSNSATGDPASLVITPGSFPTPNVMIGVCATNSNVAVSFSTASPAFDAQVAINRLRMGYRINASANQTIDMGSTGNRNHIAGGLFTFA